MPGRQTSRAGVRSEGSRGAGDRAGLERLITFSDGVFAIAITLLVLDIRLPAAANSYNNEQLLSGLLGIWHKYLAYVISFLVIGSFWISHHRKFRLIKRYDGRLLLLNVVLLMAIAFVPFPTSIISESASRTATIFYALVIALAGALMSLLWWHAAHNHRLLDPEVGARRIWREVAAPLLTSAIFLLSIGIAFINPDWAKFSWLILLPASRTAVGEVEHENPGPGT